MRSRITKHRPTKPSRFFLDGTVKAIDLLAGLSLSASHFSHVQRVICHRPIKAVARARYSYNKNLSRFIDSILAIVANIERDASFFNGKIITIVVSAMIIGVQKMSMYLLTRKLSGSIDNIRERWFTPASEKQTMNIRSSVRGIFRMSCSR